MKVDLCSRSRIKFVENEILDPVNSMELKSMEMEWFTIIDTIISQL